MSRLANGAVMQAAAVCNRAGSGAQPVLLAQAIGLAVTGPAGAGEPVQPEPGLIAGDGLRYFGIATPLV